MAERDTWTKMIRHHASSSVYSRSLDVLPLSVPKKAHTKPAARNDLPEISPLDHQIALARGTTMALETTRTQLQKAKSDRPRSFTDTLQNKWQQWKLQADENRFFEDCLHAFHDLCRSVAEIVDDLRSQEELSLSSQLAKRRRLETVRRLQKALIEAQTRELRAKEKWNSRSRRRIRASSAQWI